MLTPDPLATLQDLGRPGLADMGICAAGAADRGSLALANRLVGNAASAAGIEVTFGGLSVEAECVVLVSVCGAPCPLRLTSGAGAMNAPFYLRGGQRLTLGAPAPGCGPTSGSGVESTSPRCSGPAARTCWPAWGPNH